MARTLVMLLFQRTRLLRAFSQPRLCSICATLAIGCRNKEGLFLGPVLSVPQTVCQCPTAMCPRHPHHLHHLRQWNGCVRPRALLLRTQWRPAWMFRAIRLFSMSACQTIVPQEVMLGSEKLQLESRRLSILQLRPYHPHCPLQAPMTVSVVWTQHLLQLSLQRTVQPAAITWSVNGSLKIPTL